MMTMDDDDEDRDAWRAPVGGLYYSSRGQRQ